ncbi:unnamed protein product, partial [Staurois parvus]
LITTGFFFFFLQNKLKKTENSEKKGSVITFCK